MNKRFDRPLTAEELQALGDDDIDTSDIPELDENFWKNATVVMPDDRRKTQITAKFDTDVVDWFKQQGSGYQARMNAVLKSYVRSQKSG